MRLLRTSQFVRNTSNVDFCPIEFLPPTNPPRYAILSHRWGDAEVTFEDLKTGAVRTKAGYGKLEFCAEQATNDGIDYFWLDTCCINKANFTELSEAINSMSKWYEHATKCYVYMHDVSVTDQIQFANQENEWIAAFRSSVWFTRGWTLQELIMPSSVEFFSVEGKRIGDKKSLEHDVVQVTGLPVDVLRGLPLARFGVEERLKWAARRVTTREEDKAYCLLGLLNVQMPLIYGEGQENAMNRLKREVDVRNGSNSADFTTEQRCHQALKLCDYEFAKNSVSVNHPATCRWVLDHPWYELWRKDQKTHTIWISAGPGCGKSVLSRMLADGGLVRSCPASICYFFFNTGIPEQDSLAAALSAILHQLFNCQPHLLYHAVQEWRKVGQRMSHEIFTLQRILCKTISDPNASPVVCIFDAVDECRYQDRGRLFDLIRTCSMQEQASTNSIKFLITSRPDGCTRRRFESLAEVIPATWLQGEVDNEQLRHEIDLVIRHEIESQSTRFRLPYRFRQDLCFAISQLQQRTYLWWRLVCEGVWASFELDSAHDAAQIEHIISRLPKSLEDAYENLLSRIEPATQFISKAIFEVMLTAHRPVTTLELVWLLRGWPQNDPKAKTSCELSKYQLDRQISSFCGCLVLMNQTKLLFIHRTARDFLLTTKIGSEHCRADSQGWRHSISLPLAHYNVAIACYRLIYCERRVFNRLQFRERSDAFKYANHFVWDHMSEAVHLLAKRALFRVAGLSSFGVDLQVLDADKMSLLHHLILRAGPSTNYDIITAVLDQDGLVQSADRNNMHCLQYAVRQHDTRLVKLLLQYGFQVNRHVKRSAITDCTTCINTHNQSAAHGLTALHAAVLFGAGGTMLPLIENGADATFTDDEGRTPLHVALSLSAPGRRQSDAWEDHEYRIDHVWDFEDAKECEYVARRTRLTRLFIIRTLCRYFPAIVHKRDTRERTALHCLRYDNPEIAQVQITKLLLSYNADPGAQDADGVTPIHLAAKHANLACLDLLIPEGKEAKIGVRDIHGRTALHYAATSGDAQAVTYVLRRSKNTSLIHTVDVYDQDPLHVALSDHANHSFLSIVDDALISTLLAHRAKANRVNCRGQDALAHYVVNAKFRIDADIIKTLVRCGANVQYCDDEGVNLAHFLATNEDEISMPALLALQDFHVPVTTSDNYGRYLIHHAAIHGSVTSCLLEHLEGCLKLDLDVKDDAGKSPLEYAKEQASIKRQRHLFRSDRWRDAEVLLSKIGTYQECRWCLD